MKILRLIVSVVLLEMQCKENQVQINSIKPQVHDISPIDPDQTNFINQFDNKQYYPIDHVVVMHKDRDEIRSTFYQTKTSKISTKAKTEQATKKI